MLRTALLISVITLVTTRCDSAEEPSQGATAEPDVAATDTASKDEEDVELKNACVGTKPQSTAKAFDSECEGITECTTMPAATDGSCFCAICGVKGIDPACWQAQCPQINGPDDSDETDSSDDSTDMDSSEG